MKLRLTPQEKQQLTRERQDAPEVLDAYLRGRYHWARRKNAQIRKAIDYFNEVVRQDPEHARAFAGLADCHIILPITSDVPSLSAFPKAKAALEKALSIDNSLAEAYTSLGTIKFWFDWDWMGAERAYQHAIDLNPNYAVAHLYYAHCLSNWGKHSKALEEILLARRLDPLSPIINTLYAEFLYHARRYAEAMPQFTKALELDPQFWGAHIAVAKVYEQTGRFTEALDHLQKAGEFSGGNTETLSMMAYVSAKAGERRQAEHVLRELTDIERKGYVPPYNFAVPYAGLGDKDRALEWLGKAYEQRDVHLTFLLDPKWDAFCSDSRFQDLVQRVGLPNR